MLPLFIFLCCIFGFTAGQKSSDSYLRRKDYDTGGGLVQRKGDRYNLVAALSTNIGNELSPSTNITRHFDLHSQNVSRSIREKRTNRIEGEYADETTKVRSPKLTRITRDESDESGHCLLPSKPGVLSYKIDSSNCSEANKCVLNGGEWIPCNIQVRINCALGYGPASNTSEYGETFTCINGSWSEREPECIKLCPPLRKENLNIECSLESKTVSCDTYMRPDTIAKFRCDELYQASYDPTSHFDNTRCIPGGTWSDKLPTCSLECGLKNQVNRVEATLLYGNKTTYGEYPWHVAIYLLSSNRYQYICGGSLISESFILTAAHCMFHPVTYDKIKEEDLKVAAGKGKIDYYNHELYQVNSDVINIIIPDSYVGDGTRYTEDIALLHTAVYFKFNYFVLPVCIDRFGVVKLRNNIKGTIVGWGLTEAGALSEELQEVRVSTMPITQCREKFREFLQFLTTDKYCVVHKNGSGTQRGDSGGGMTFEVRGQHYIHGIVSLKSRNSNNFSVFTNVSTYLDWIYNSMRNSVPNTISKKCGILNNIESTETTPDGKISRHGEYPWAVLIIGYHSEKSNTVLRLVASAGTLIHESFVLTVAHRMMEILDKLGQNITNFNNQNKDVRVLAGLNKVTGTTHQQIRPVSNIIIPKGFSGRLYKVEHHVRNIALVQLEKPFTFNDFVLPACLERSRLSFEVQPGDMGTYVDWPKQGKGSWRENHVSVPNRSRCTRYGLQEDKFCTEYIGLSPKNVFETGNGLTFTYKGRHYLRGVSTLQLIMDYDTDERLTVFTNVSVYRDWITKEVESRLLYN